VETGGKVVGGVKEEPGGRRFRDGGGVGSAIRRRSTGAGLAASLVE
jgi:hypothetical protein